MARRHLLEKLSGQEQSLAQVWDWYELQLGLVGAEQKQVLEAATAGSPSHPRYFDRTRDELVAFFDGQRLELAYAAMLGMLAATEAALRIDYMVRVARNRKDEISQEFAQIYRQSRLKVGLEDQILEAWQRTRRAPSRKPSASSAGHSTSATGWPTAATGSRASGRITTHSTSSPSATFCWRR